MAKLFSRDKSLISRHLHNVFATKELDRKSVVAKNATTAADGKTYQVDYFNLDAILSVGYRGKLKTRHLIPRLGDPDFTGSLIARLYPQRKADS
jgi:hypothetical protein